jgi:hypothetical protein
MRLLPKPTAFLDFAKTILTRFIWFGLDVQMMKSWFTSKSRVFEEMEGSDLLDKKMTPIKLFASAPHQRRIYIFSPNFLPLRDLSPLQRNSRNLIAQSLNMPRKKWMCVYSFTNPNFLLTSLQRQKIRQSLHPRPPTSK